MSTMSVDFINENSTCFVLALCFTNKRFLVTYFLFENKIVRTIIYFYSLLLDVDV